jgi:hypothetical protein
MHASSAPKNAASKAGRKLTRRGPAWQFTQYPLAVIVFTHPQREHAGRPVCRFIVVMVLTSWAARSAHLAGALASLLLGTL